METIFLTADSGQPTAINTEKGARERAPTKKA